jgi:hypothetical protein
MNRLPESKRSDTWLTCGEQKHHVHLSHAYTTLGDTSRARESRQRALELSAPTSTMTRTLLHVDAAACAHHGGDSEQACRRTDRLAHVCDCCGPWPGSVGVRPGVTLPVPMSTTKPG